jgi:glycyl-tRNA synthetase alpha chain
LNAWRCISGRDNVYDITWVDGVTYGDVHHQGEWTIPTTIFTVADTDMLFSLFGMFEKNASE